MRLAAALCVVMIGSAHAATVETRVALFLREHPVQSARVVERVAAGRKVQLIGRSPDREWVHVSVGRRDGWLPAAQVNGLQRGRGAARVVEEEQPLAARRAVRPEAWVEQPRYHDGGAPERVKISAARVDLIARPTDGAQVVGFVRRGEVLGVIRASRDGRWYLVEQGAGEVAWVAAAQVKPLGGIPVRLGDENAVAAAPQTPISDPPVAPVIEETPPPAPVVVATPAIEEELPPPPVEKPSKKRKHAAVVAADPPPAPAASMDGESASAPTSVDGELVAVMAPAQQSYLWGSARVGVGLVGQRFTSNASGYLTNYETSADAMALDLELGYHRAIGKRVFIGLDGAYRFAGATGIKVAAPDGGIVLGLQVHDLDAGATLGAHFAVLGGLDASLHLGARILVELLDQNAKALLPSDRYTFFAVGGRLEAPALWRGLGARIDAQLLAPGSIAQTGGVGEGQSDGALGVAVGATAGYSVGHGVTVEAGYRYALMTAHLDGASERNKAITAGDRSTVTHLFTAGIVYQR
jgi:hypothetical protein